jgi:hypothetical protein
MLAEDFRHSAQLPLNVLWLDFRHAASTQLLKLLE